MRYPNDYPGGYICQCITLLIHDVPCTRSRGVCLRRQNVPYIGLEFFARSVTCTKYKSTTVGMNRRSRWSPARSPSFRRGAPKSLHMPHHFSRKVPTSRVSGSRWSASRSHGWAPLARQIQRASVYLRRVTGHDRRSRGLYSVRGSPDGATRLRRSWKNGRKRCIVKAALCVLHYWSPCTARTIC